MTLNVRLSPQTEALLIQQAVAAGVDPSSFVARILERAISQSLDTAADSKAGAPLGDVKEFDTALDELFRDDARSLPEASLRYSRSDIYTEHD